MKRNRLVAIAIVICTALGATIATGAPAPGDLYEIIEDPSTTRTRIPMAVTRSVLSIRNISAGSRVFSLTSSGTGCSQTTAIQIGASSSITNVTLAAGEQKQFETSSMGSAVPVSIGCTWTITDASFSQQFQTSHQYASTQPDLWDLQPRSLKFRSNETQQVYVQNYSASAQSYTSVRLTQTSGTSGALTFASGLTTCTMFWCEQAGSSVAGDAFATADVQCNLADANPVTGTLELLVGGSPIQSTPITCGPGAAAPGIELSPATLILGALPTGSVQVTSTDPMMANTLMQAELFGDADFVFDGVPCTGTANLCNPMGGVMTPVSLPIECTPTMVTRQATLVVTPVNGLPVMSVVECIQTSTGPPMLHVSPDTILAGDRAVSTTSNHDVTITNIGAGTLEVYAMPPGGDWTVTGCPQSAPCQLVGNGSNTTIEVTFAPTAHGIRSSSMTIVGNSGAMSENVTLTGTGTGGVLAVTEPTAAQTYTLEFGTVGLNTPRTRTIKLRNNGNVSTSATLSMTPGAPFMLSASSISLPASPLMDSPVSVTCESATPVEDNRSITITKAASAYRTEPVGLFDANGVATISTHCKVVATTVQISPELDFKEVWKGTPTAEIMVSIKNPSTALTSATVTGVSLVNGVQPLTLGPIVPSGFPRTLAPGEELLTTLSLATTAEVDVGTARLKVTVDGVDLEQPISGKVVTPSARLAPSDLDLGTACIGSDVSGTVMLINDGTATLTIMRPTMDGAFTPIYLDPTTYGVDGTALLAPMRNAIAAVRPSMMAGPGRLTGTLTWPVAGPGPFTVGVALTYVTSGAAVSPGRLAFGPINVDEASNRQTITLENCNPTPVDVVVEGVLAKTGPASAWDVQPRTETRTLAPQAKLMVSVAFAPKRPGLHLAELQLVVDGEQRVVPLEGDGLGVTIDRSSFYACTCQGAGAPLAGWPVVLALAFLFAPRRRRGRRSISARSPSESS